MTRSSIPSERLSGAAGRPQASSLERAAPWLGRFALAAAGVVLLLVGSKFISDPAGAAAASHTVLGSAVAVTNMRASFGAFPLGCALVAFGSLASRRLHLVGLSVVATVLATVIAVRIFGIIVDATLRESLTVLSAETILLLLTTAAIVAEAASRQKGEKVRGDVPL